MTRGPASGFSLLETLVALVVLGIGLVAVAAGIMVSIASNTKAAEQGRAALLAVQKIEELKTRAPADVQTEPAVSVSEDGTEGAGPYKRRVEVVDGPEGPFTKGVTVTVSYQAGRFGSSEVRLYTLLFSDS